MGTFIIISVIAVIGIIAVKTYIKNLAHGCCGMGDNTTKNDNAKDIDLSEYTHEYNVQISGMTCKNCGGRIEKRFNKLEGTYATASHKDGNARIYSVNETSELLIRQIVVELGYTVESIQKV